MNKKGNKPRVKAIAAAVSLMLLAVLLRVYYLPLFGAHYEEGLYSTAVRGTIYDRNGEILAIQAPDYGFIADGSDPAKEASFISRFTEENAISVERKISDGQKFIPITMIPSREDAEEIEKMLWQSDLSNELILARKEDRKTIAGSAFIGEVDEDFNGISGIERLCQDILDADEGRYPSASFGNDVYLTIDKEAQLRLESLGLDAPAAVISDGFIIAWSGEIPAPMLAFLVKSVKTHDGTIIYSSNDKIPIESRTGISGLSYYSADESSIEAIADAFSDEIIS